MMRLPLLPCLAALLLAGCYDSSFGTRTNGPVPLETSSIRELRARYAGQTFPVTGDIVVSGRVTATDEGGNFYRSFCIEQDGAGMEIMAGTDHLHNDYPEGALLSVRLRGFALGESRGVLQLGRMPAAGSGFATDYIGQRPALAGVIVRSDAPLQSVEPALRTIRGLRSELCGTLVRIDALRYTPEDLTNGTWAGYKRFTDAGGEAIYTYVRTYAGFAAKEVPVGTCSLTGILQYDPASNGRYILKLRDESDCLH
ncbi:DUF5689 domain-containing protein [Alistipes sp.]|uniref:DUF5689 domain-containing protein n=1 Tax=Alistipes sp. TaxID=1872444 RepID=UPI003AEFEB5F